jgi:hypothetical protein
MNNSHRLQELQIWPTFSYGLTLLHRIPYSLSPPEGYHATDNVDKTAQLPHREPTSMQWKSESDRGRRDFPKRRHLGQSR